MSEQTQDNNIDHLLTGQIGEVKAEIPEDKPKIEESSETKQQDEYDLGDDNASEHSEQEEEKNEQQEDAYGNEQTPERTYSESEVNERINQAVRERLARLERKGAQDQQNEVKKVKDEFNYDPDSEQTWQQQLQSFVKQTVTQMSQEQYEKARLAQEQQAEAEFVDKFQRGMTRFKDFTDVVSQMPITDAMTLATRSLSDPSAFIYAASKRAPEELKRISAIPDQYAQMVEVGKLEERLRKSKVTTNAPRPLAKQKEDVTAKPEKQKREETIEDRILEAERRKLNQMNARYRR